MRVFGKTMLVGLVISFFSHTICFAEESKKRYELFEGTASSNLVGDQPWNAKATFLLDTYTGEVYIYVPQEGGWVLTSKTNKRT